MKVFFSARARRRAGVVAKWWRAHRPTAPALFENELEGATRRLENLVVLGVVCSTVRGRPVYRMLLPQTAQHVYYSIAYCTHPAARSQPTNHRANYDDPARLVRSRSIRVTH